MRAYSDSTQRQPDSQEDSSRNQFAQHEGHRKTKLNFYELSWIRPRSVRAKVISLLMVPIVCLMALWAFVTVITVQHASDLTRSQKINADLLAQSRYVVAATQAERATALSYLTNPSTDLLATFISRAKDTDAAVRDGLRFDARALGPSPQERFDHLREAVGNLTKLRSRIEASGARPTGRDNRPRSGIGKNSAVKDTSDARWADTYSSYAAVIDRGLSVSDFLAMGIENSPIVLVPLEISRAREMISRESLILSAARENGGMSGQQHQEFIESVSSQRLLLSASADELKSTDRDAVMGMAYQTLRTCEDAVEAAGPKAGCSVNEQAWANTVKPVTTALLRMESEASVQPQGRKDSLSDEVLSTSGVMILLGLGGVLLSLLVSVRIGRGLMADLAGLRMAASELAERSLPRAMRRLDAGERVNIDAEAPLQQHGHDEVGQVRSALNSLHRGVLHLASERASLKEAVHRAAIAKSVSGVYVNLARRSQPLLQQQFEVLDGLQRTAQDPHMMGELFRLDHLTARMRRHTENLIILSGSTPPRWWSEPVSLLSLLRAALAEVNDYPRVELQDVPEHYLAGSAVADLSHLIAELLENALTFSPPTTMVRVRAEPSASGLSLKIEDRGLGMSQETMLQANLRVQDPSVINLTGANQLGLFVVNRLARRSGVKVRLGNSSHHGVTATVLIPRTLLRAHTVPAPPRATADPSPSHTRSTRPAQPVPLPASSPPPRYETASTTGSALPLPQRVRQANLVPELRDAPSPPSPLAASLDPQVDLPRSPTAARATITAMQSGWRRGRSAKNAAGFPADAAPVRPTPAETSTGAEHSRGSASSETFRGLGGDVIAEHGEPTDAAAYPPDPAVARAHGNASGDRTQ